MMLLNSDDISSSSVNKLGSTGRLRGGSDVVKGKGVILGPRQRLGFRRRRRAAVEQRRPSSSALSCDPPPPQLGWQGEQQLPYGMSEQWREMSGENSTPLNSGGGHHIFPVNREHPGNFDSVEGTTPDIGLNCQLNKCDAVGENTLSAAPGSLELDRNNVNVIRILEQALEEEQAARAALYAELEKERSAAASATDEAMAMIRRLQKEKALIEMEARQYQRMVEEKAAYDEEEMDILKEIIVRHEREKHVLETEVEIHRQMMLSEEVNGHQSVDELNDTMHMTGHKPNSSSTLTEYSEQVPRQSCESVRTKEMMSDDNGQPDNGPSIVEKQISSGGYDHELPSLGLVELACSLKPVGIDRAQIFDKNHLEVLDEADQCNLDFQEKSMLSVDAYPSPHQSQNSRFGDGSGLFNGSQGHDFHNKFSVSVEKEDGESDSRTEVRLPYDGADLENRRDAGDGGCESCTSKLETESSVLDVHVIDDKLCREGNGKESDSQVGGTSANFQIDDIPFEAYGSRSFDVFSHSSTSWTEAEQKIHRSSTDLSKVLSLMDGSCAKGLLNDLRRNSMSAIDNERLKLETEVEFLRERLKIIQQGREKLSFSLENKENENFQLQLLGEIASQLHEIRQLTEPGRTIRQVSLPPSSSKVNSKKRRCRSVSWGVHEST